MKAYFILVYEEPPHRTDRPDDNSVRSIMPLLSESNTRNRRFNSAVRSARADSDRGFDPAVPAYDCRATHTHTQATR